MGKLKNIYQFFMDKWINKISTVNSKTNFISNKECFRSVRRNTNLSILKWQHCQISFVFVQKLSFLNLYKHIQNIYYKIYIFEETSSSKWFFVLKKWNKAKLDVIFVYAAVKFEYFANSMDETMIQKGFFGIQ